MLSLRQHLEKYQNSSKYIFDGRPIIKQVHENELKLVRVYEGEIYNIMCIQFTLIYVSY